MNEHEECIAEFGPHEDHEDCAQLLAEMSGYLQDDLWDLEYQNYMYGSSRYGFPIGD